MPIVPATKEHPAYIVLTPEQEARVAQLSQEMTQRVVADLLAHHIPFEIVVRPSPKSPRFDLLKFLHLR
ncbi:hypothetical protein M1116_03970 [Patescibacteria group bacterium]|nr:hypothetical protein [Patescibacteria group bacterium]